MKTETTVFAKTEVRIDLATSERFPVDVPYRPGQRITVDTITVINSTVNGATRRVSILASGRRLLKDGTHSAATQRRADKTVGWYPFYRGELRDDGIPVEVTEAIRIAGIEWALGPTA